jgi:large subunit ribosomal protein L19e
MKSQKEMASRILKCGANRVWLDPSRINDIAEAITAEDVRKLVRDKVIKAEPKKGISSFRKKKLKIQKSKGRRKGKGSRKGKIGTRVKEKTLWVKKIRIIRSVIKELRDTQKMTKTNYRKIYRISKSGFFRSRAHLMNYLEKNELIKGEKNV